MSKTKINIVIKYLHYLSTWNSGDSLISTIKDINDNISGYERNINALLIIIDAEYYETQNMTNDKVMRFEEYLDTLVIGIRDVKIEKILS